MISRAVLGVTCLLELVLASTLPGVPRAVLFSRPVPSIEVYDFVEITAQVEGPDAPNPFTDVTVRSSFGKVGGSVRTEVEGFCDAADGSLFRIRFMPSSPGNYSYSLVYHQGEFEVTQTGEFQAVDGHRRGPIRVDPEYPWHFLWEGTREHYFFNPGFPR